MPLDFSHKIAKIKIEFTDYGGLPLVWWGAAVSSSAAQLDTIAKDVTTKIRAITSLQVERVTWFVEYVNVDPVPATDDIDQFEFTGAFVFMLDTPALDLFVFEVPGLLVEYTAGIEIDSADPAIAAFVELFTTAVIDLGEPVLEFAIAFAFMRGNDRRADM